MYATSNRRHLLPEHMSENLELYAHTTTAISIRAKRRRRKSPCRNDFGLWLSFYPFKQDDYLGIVAHWLRHFGCDPAQIASARDEALRWALQRGSRSGRVAWQFAKDFAGKMR